MQLMFDRAAIEDVVVTPHAQKITPDCVLVRLLRLIFYRYNITLDDFSRLYSTYGQRAHWTPDEVRIRHNNDRKAMTSTTKLTLYLFRRITTNILHLNIEAFEIVLRDPATGLLTTYNSGPDFTS